MANFMAITGAVGKTGILRRKGSIDMANGLLPTLGTAKKAY